MTRPEKGAFEGSTESEAREEEAGDIDSKDCTPPLNLLKDGTEPRNNREHPLLLTTSTLPPPPPIVTC